MLTRGMREALATLPITWLLLLNIILIGNHTNHVYREKYYICYRKYLLLAKQLYIVISL